MQFSKYKHGGDEEDRTPDPLLARQVLSQLSYTPIVSLIFLRVSILSNLPVPDDLSLDFFSLSVRFLRV